MSVNLLDLFFLLVVLAGWEVAIVVCVERMVGEANKSVNERRKKEKTAQGLGTKRRNE